jgi:UTP--glucose-1-phosphate uridylyltransferase
MTRQIIRKAVLPVAGLGTRVLPATKTVPKEMLTVYDRPAIHYVVDEAREAGIEHIVFVTGRNKGAIEDYFDIAYELEDTLSRKGKSDILMEIKAALPAAGTTSFVRQHAPQGLGHAIWCARDVVGREPFAILLPDMLMMGEPGCLAQMAEAYRSVGGNIISVEEVPRAEVSSYGIIAPGKDDGTLVEMTGMVEKPKPEDAPSNLMISGRYILQPEIFDLLEAQDPGAGGEIQLTDAMAKLMERQGFHARRFDGTSYDIGSKIGLLEANLAYALASDDAVAARAVIKAAVG